MAKNLVQKDGKYISIALASKLSGDPVMKGSIKGVALVDTDSAGNLSIDVGPAVYSLSVKGINDAGNSAVTVGDKIFYVDGDTPKLSKKASGNFWGYALGTVAEGATTAIPVLLVPAPGPGESDVYPPPFVCIAAGNHTTTGGAAIEDIEVTGMLATDIPIVTIKNDGTSNVTLLMAAAKAGGGNITCTFSADPGADVVVNYAVLRAL